MSTPPRLVELKCPRCSRTHWETDCDFRGAILVGERELAYPDRTYRCPHCDFAQAGYSVQRKSPDSFLLQPQGGDPMEAAEFREWLRIYRKSFPDSEKLRDVRWAATGGWMCAADAWLRRARWQMSLAARPKFPCPCCGYIVFLEPPGSYAMCPICRWEDDAFALEFATTMHNGANTSTLAAAQKAFAQVAAESRERRGGGRAPRWLDRRDPAWRPIDETRDVFPAWSRPDFGDWPEKKSADQLYYWRTRRRDAEPEQPER